MAILQTSKYTVFCRVVELGSFSLAAEELGYTQSSVSQKSSPWRRNWALLCSCGRKIIWN